MGKCSTDIKQDLIDYARDQLLPTGLFMGSAEDTLELSFKGRNNMRSVMSKVASVNERFKSDILSISFEDNYVAISPSKELIDKYWNSYQAKIKTLKTQDFKTKIGESSELKNLVDKLKKSIDRYKDAYFVINIENDIQSDSFFLKEDAEKALKEYNSKGDLKFKIEKTIGLRENEIEVYKDVISFLAKNPDQNPFNEKYTGSKKLEEYLKYKYELTTRQVGKILNGDKEKSRLVEFINTQLELSQAQKIEGVSGLPNNLAELEASKAKTESNNVLENIKDKTFETQGKATSYIKNASTNPFFYMTVETSSGWKVELQPQYRGLADKISKIENCR
jgi:esterase/lipase